jgi:predicted nucleotidyltransferase
MRLTRQQVEAIRHSAVEVFGPEARVWLFGSRVDDRKRGGDIDLLIRPMRTGSGSSIEGKLRFLRELERRIGERKVDVVLEEANDSRPIVRVAHETGVVL